MTTDAGGIQVLSGNGSLALTAGLLKAKGSLRATGIGDILAFMGTTEVGGLELLSSPYGSAPDSRRGADERRAREHDLRGGRIVTATSPGVAASSWTVDGSVNIGGGAQPVPHVRGHDSGRVFHGHRAQICVVRVGDLTVGGRRYRPGRLRQP